MKTIALATLATLVSTPVLAGPYYTTKTEFNGEGSKYDNTFVQGRIGYERPVGKRFSPYVEVGGGAVTPQGGDGYGVFVTEVGSGVRVTDQLSASASIENLRFKGDNNWKATIQTKYTF